jgi:hypothetical protein
METQQVPPQAVILHIIADYWRSRAVYLAARLKLADAVGNSRLGLADLAAATATRPEALRRLLRALTAHGIFREEDDGKFTQTPLSEVLRSGSTGSMRAFAEVELGHDHYDSWRDAESCLTLPGTAFERIFNMPIWRYYAEHPELEALFGEAMTNLTAITNAGVLGSYQFGAFAPPSMSAADTARFLPPSSTEIRRQPVSCSIFLRISRTPRKGSSSAGSATVSGSPVATSSRKCQRALTSTCSNSSCMIGMTLIASASSPTFARQSLRADALRSWRWFYPAATNRISVR